ncbi:MAG TPA: hypothetical protein VGP33_01380 [Chloroflexota bacterium]|nr:hypothetical protein [Chloroflexota bacterium]
MELADRQRRPATLRLTMGEEGGVAFNRRFFMREGPARTNPGKQHPDIVAPAGPVDPRVWTVSALPTLDGNPTTGSASVPPHRLPLGPLVNFGLHAAVVVGAVLGGDFPFFLAMGVQRLLGPGGNSAVSAAVSVRLAPAAPISSPAARSTPRPWPPGGRAGRPSRWAVCSATAATMSIR